MAGWQDKAILLDAPPATGWRSKAIPLDQTASGPTPQQLADKAYADYMSSPAVPPPADAGPGYIPPAPPPKPEGFDQRLPQFTPEAWNSPPQEDPYLRSLKLGAQASGAGIADIAGFPVDITTLGLNVGLSGADKLSHWLGGGGVDFRYRDPFGGSQSIQDAGAAATDALFGKGTIIQPQDMSPAERMAYTGARFATGAGVASGGLAALAREAPGLLPAALEAPYTAEGSLARTYAGDIAAGGGAGLMTEAYHQYAPQYVQDKLGPLGDIIAGFGGAVGGAGLLSAGEKLAGAGARSIAARTPMPREIAGVDPITKMPVSKLDFSNAAAMLQGKAFNPEQAKAQISDYLSQIGEGPAPTLGPLSADPGLLAAERRARAANPAGFIARDQAVMDSVGQRVASVRPEAVTDAAGQPVLGPNGAPLAPNPEAPRPVAERINQETMGAARADQVAADLKLAEAKKAQDALAAEAAAGRTRDQASRDLHTNMVDQTYIPDRTTKNALYDAAAADPNVVVRTEKARAAADQALATAADTNPALRDPQAMRIADAFTRPKEAGASNPDLLPVPYGSTPGSAQPPVTRTLGQVLADRQALSRTEADARAQGSFGLADTARSIRSGVNADVRAAAESGVPGTEKLAAADANYRNEFAPAYRQGAVAPDFFKNVDRSSPQNPMVPEATAGKFLTAGPTSRAAAEDLAKVIARTPDPAAAKAAASDYVLADAVKSGVIQNGTVSETRLAAFMANREGMFSQIPEIKARFNDLLTRARTGNTSANKLAADLMGAEKKLNLTEQEVNNGVLAMISGHEPRKAVSAVFAAPDSVKAMRDATAAFKNDPQAAAGWKAAVADWMQEKVATASKAGVSADEMATSLPAIRRTFQQNEKALAEVFSPEEMNTLRQAQARLEVLSKRGTQASTGSATAENMGGLRGVLKAFASPVGTFVTFARNAIQAGMIERRINLIAEQFPDANATAKAIVDRAWTDPELAKHLLSAPTSDAQVYTWSRTLSKLLNVGKAGNTNLDSGGAQQ